MVKQKEMIKVTQKTKTIKKEESGGKEPKSNNDTKRLEQIESNYQIEQRVEWG